MDLDVAVAESGGGSGVFWVAAGGVGAGVLWMATGLSVWPPLLVLFVWNCISCANSFVEHLFEEEKDLMIAEGKESYVSKWEDNELQLCNETNMTTQMTNEVCLAGQF
jgi:hypothetical protein